MKSVPLADLVQDPITRAVLAGQDLGAAADLQSAAALYRSRDVDRAPLAASIEATMNASRSAGDDAWRRALDDLARPGTLAVVTGQQIGALGGPLYSVYKALAASALARELSGEGFGRVVPVFWMATQDHDLAEIDHAHVIDAHGDLMRLRFRCMSGGAPVGLLRVTRDMVAAFAQWTGAMHPTASSSLLELLAPCEGESWPTWFARCMRACLPGTDVLYFDPLTHARPTTPLLAKALTESVRVRAALDAGIARLAGKSLRASLASDAASLVFDHRDGRRERLRVDDAAVVKHGRRTSLASTLAAVASAPAAFSGNVALRPVLQGALLPCIAYVGGPAEIAYYQQLPELFRFFDVPFPAIVPRFSATVLTPRARELLRRLAVTDVQAIAEPARLTPHLAADGSAASAREQVTRLLDRYAANLPAMNRSVARARRTLERVLDRLARQARLLAPGERRLARGDALTNLIRPNGKLQERVLSAATFVVEYGATPLVSDLARQDPRLARHYVIDL
ncbi:MAG: bacillithiol biosynthesis cysteine-adding enzyme BshC [Planctomycetota bacterium]